MPSRNLTPEQTAEAKRLCEGDYGKEKARYVWQFVAPLIMTTWDGNEIVEQRNGTVTLLDLPNRRVGVTCHHVLKMFRDQQERNAPAHTTLSVSLDEIDLETLLIDESADLDLATLDFRDYERFQREPNEAVASTFHAPPTWPPPSITIDDALHLGGFPETWRSRSDESRKITFGPAGFAGQFVESVEDARIVACFDRDYWVRAGKGLHLRDLSGMSGGAAIVSRGGLIEYFEMAGILCEYNSGYDAVFVTPADLIRPDGTLDTRVLVT